MLIIFFYMVINSRFFGISAPRLPSQNISPNLLNVNIKIGTNQQLILNVSKIQCSSASLLSICPSLPVILNQCQINVSASLVHAGWIQVPVCPRRGLEGKKTAGGHVARWNAAILWRRRLLLPEPFWAVGAINVLGKDVRSRSSHGAVNAHVI